MEGTSRSPMSGLGTTTSACAGSYQPLQAEGDPCLCDGIQEGTRLQAALLQHHFPAPDADILCLAGKGTIEPNWEQPYAVPPHAVLLSLLEHRCQLQ